MQSILIDGDRKEDLERILILRGFYRDRELLKRSGGDVYIQAICGGKKDGFLPLGDDPARAEEILRWFFDPQLSIKKASLDDLEEIVNLKKQIILDAFTFMSIEEREDEVKRVAGIDHMEKELQKNKFWVCRKGGDLWAVAGLCEEEAMLYSAYSRGQRAGAALLSQRMLAAEHKDSLSARVYGDNTWSARHLKRQGFRLTNRLFITPIGLKVRYWTYRKSNPSPDTYS